MGNPDTHYPKRGDKDTAYTAGFKAGVAWREAEIIKLLEAKREKCACYGIGMVVCRHTPTIDETIAVIKEEK